MNFRINDNNSKNSLEKKMKDYLTFDEFLERVMNKSQKIKDDLLDRRKNYGKYLEENLANAK